MKVLPNDADQWSPNSVGNLIEITGSLAGQVASSITGSGSRGNRDAVAMFHALCPDHGRFFDGPATNRDVRNYLSELLKRLLDATMNGVEKGVDESAKLP